MNNILPFVVNIDIIQISQSYVLEINSGNFIICLQAFFNYLMPDHDAKVFNPPSTHRISNWDVIVNLLLGGFRRWDAVYFLHIAEHGYTYENSLAFFPLFPMVVRFLAKTLFSPLLFIMNYQSVLLITAVAVNLICFIQSAKMLYALGVKVLGDDMLSYKAAQLYCINPASIFFSAAYSESMFALMSFWGMFYVEDGSLLKAALFFSLSAGTRANGIVNAGYILHKKFIELCQKMSSLQKSQFNNTFTMVMAVMSTLWFSAWSAIFLLTVCMASFIFFQFYAYEMYCSVPASKEDMPSHILNYGNENHYKMPHTGLASWCHDHLPFSYFYVQNTHWDNGFLRYYHFKQIPNFLLAAPMVGLCLFAVSLYIGKNTTYCVTLGLYDPRDSAHKKSDDGDEEMGVTGRKALGFENKRCLTYIIHMLFLVVFGMLCMHVQVGSSPIPLQAQSDCTCWFP